MIPGHAEHEWLPGFHMGFPIWFVADRGEPMKPINITGFCQLGQVLGALRGIQKGSDMRLVIFVCVAAIKALDEFISAPIAPLPHCSQSAVDLRAVLNSIMEVDAIKKFDLPPRSPSLAEIAKGLGEPGLHFALASSLQHCLRTFEANLFADLAKLDTYLLEKKRTHEAASLVDGAEATLSPANAKALTDFALENIREAGRCLVFDRFTAVGFHAMRSVEDVARRYYALVTGRLAEGRDRNGADFYRTLGQMAQELATEADSLRGVKKSTGQLGVVAPLLQQLCRIYRNTLDHPELIALEPEQAIDVFNQGMNVISTMLDDVRSGGSHFRWGA